MILSAQSIRRHQEASEFEVLCGAPHPFLDPFVERTVDPASGMSFGLSSAGYDIRLGRDVSIEANGFTLAVSLEHFSMPDRLVARVHDKSTWARQGVFVQNTIIEPGWCGFLTLELTYHRPQRMPTLLQIPAGTPIAQIVFERLDEPTEQPYRGKYQDQPAEPVPARREEASNATKHQQIRGHTTASHDMREGSGKTLDHDTKPLARASCRRLESGQWVPVIVDPDGTRRDVGGLSYVTKGMATEAAGEALRAGG